MRLKIAYSEHSQNFLRDYCASSKKLRGTKEIAGLMRHTRNSLWGMPFHW